MHQGHVEFVIYSLNENPVFGTRPRATLELGPNVRNPTRDSELNQKKSYYPPNHHRWHSRAARRSTTSIRRPPST